MKTIRRTLSKCRRSIYQTSKSRLYKTRRTLLQNRIPNRPRYRTNHRYALFYTIFYTHLFSFPFVLTHFVPSHSLTSQSHPTTTIPNRKKRSSSSPAPTPAPDNSRPSYARAGSYSGAQPRLQPHRLACRSTPRGCVGRRGGGLRVVGIVAAGGALDHHFAAAAAGHSSGLAWFGFGFSAVVA
jgi:hypothetical protein